MAEMAAKRSMRSGSAAAMLLGGAVTLLALPSAVLAFSSRLALEPLVDLAHDGARSEFGRFVAAHVDPRLGRSIAVRALSMGRTFQFTPAVTPSRSDHSVTVAVRLDSAISRSIVVREASPAAEAGGPLALRIAPTAYSLGMARGYRSFAQNNAAAEGRRAEMPDLVSFRPAPGVTGDPGRLSPRIALDEHQKAGRSPRTFEGQGDQTVDLGGSYRLTGNLNVTAGVRYSSDRDRLVPLNDRRQDSQAVYVGTQFRF